MTFNVSQLQKTPQTSSLLISSLSFSAGDEGSGRPVSPPRPTQLPSCPPLSDASVLASRSRGQTDVWHPPFLFGSAYQAPCLPQGRASSVRWRKHMMNVLLCSWIHICSNLNSLLHLQKLLSAITQPHPHRLNGSGDCQWLAESTEDGEISGGVWSGTSGHVRPSQHAHHGVSIYGHLYSKELFYLFYF